MEERVSGFIRRHHLAPRGKLVVAVSGGPDSVCLLHILNQLKDGLKVSLHAAHLNHMLRGLDSDADAAYVTDLCAHLGVPVTVERRDVAAYQAEQRLSLEEAARQVRYTFLQEVAASLGTDRVAVAHTADDQAETILLHLVRGSGLRGMRGMQPVSAWKTANGKELVVVRPLLETSRTETEAYCSTNRLEPRYDVSNVSPAFLRNRLRHELLPLLAEYNPSIKETLLRTALLMDDDYAFIEEQADSLRAEIARQERSHLVLDRARFSRLHPSLQRHLLRRSVEQFLGNLRDVEAVHIERMMDCLVGPAGKCVSLPGGLVLTTEYGRAVLGYDSETSCPLPPLEGSPTIKVPGETEFPGWRVRASLSSAKASLSEDDPWRTCFDFDKLGPVIEVRARRRGDRFQPLGQEQPHKLQDFMVNARIPRRWRDNVPLVVSGEDIVWVAGWRIADPPKVTPQTRRVLCLEFQQTA